MKETFDSVQLVVDPPNPALGFMLRAYIECGCQVLCGRRLDNFEVATMVSSCSPAHDQIATHFNMLLAESTVDPMDAPLVDVCEELLEQAAQYALGS